MIDPISLFIALFIILIWLAARSFLPKLLKTSISSDAHLKDPQQKKKLLLVRMSIVTGLLLIWGVATIIVTGGTGHENNRTLLEVLLFGIGLIWIIGILAVRRG